MQSGVVEECENKARKVDSAKQRTEVAPAADQVCRCVLIQTSLIRPLAMLLQGILASLEACNAIVSDYSMLT